jgi:hypothetical protein
MRRNRALLSGMVLPHEGKIVCKWNGYVINEEQESSTQHNFNICNFTALSVLLLSKLHNALTYKKQ